MTEQEIPISQELFEILRCPLAVQDKEKYGDDPGKLRIVKNSWLVSDDSGLKYPIRDGIPVMLIDEGEKWKNTADDELPVPPPTE
ncbi:MAG: Trm112 family protein [Anaerolineae bacterium]